MTKYSRAVGQLAGVEHLDDVGVTGRAGGPGLGAEPLGHGRVVRLQSKVRTLIATERPDGQVLAQVDVAHPAATEPREHPVAIGDHDPGLEQLLGVEAPGRSARGRPARVAEAGRRLDLGPVLLTLEESACPTAARWPLVSSRRSSARVVDSTSRASPNSLRMKSETISWPISGAWSASHWLSASIIAWAVSQRSSRSRARPFITISSRVRVDPAALASLARRPRSFETESVVMSSGARSGRPVSSSHRITATA